MKRLTLRNPRAVAALAVAIGVTLAAVSLRLGGRRLLFDAAQARVTNVPEANAYLGREYRKGWELTGA